MEVRYQLRHSPGCPGGSPPEETAEVYPRPGRPTKSPQACAFHPLGSASRCALGELPSGSCRASARARVAWCWSSPSRSATAQRGETPCATTRAHSPAPSPSTSSRSDAPPAGPPRRASRRRRRAGRPRRPSWPAGRLQRSRTSAVATPCHWPTWISRQRWSSATSTPAARATCSAVTARPRQVRGDHPRRPVCREARPAARGLLDARARTARCRAAPARRRRRCGRSRRGGPRATAPARLAHASRRLGTPRSISGQSFQSRSSS